MFAHFLIKKVQNANEGRKKFSIVSISTCVSSELPKFRPVFTNFFKSKVAAILAAIFDDVTGPGHLVEHITGLLFKEKGEGCHQPSTHPPPPPFVPRRGILVCLRILVLVVYTSNITTLYRLKVDINLILSFFLFFCLSQ